MAKLSIKETIKLLQDEARCQEKKVKLILVGKGMLFRFVTSNIRGNTDSTILSDFERNFQFTRIRQKRECFFKKTYNTLELLKLRCSSF